MHPSREKKSETIFASAMIERARPAAILEPAEPLLSARDALEHTTRMAPVLAEPTLSARVVPPRPAPVLGDAEQALRVFASDVADLKEGLHSLRLQVDTLACSWRAEERDSSFVSARAKARRAAARASLALEAPARLAGELIGDYCRIATQGC